MYKFPYELRNKFRCRTVHPKTYELRGYRINPNSMRRFGKIPTTGCCVYFWRKNGGHEWIFGCTKTLRRTAHGQFYDKRGKIGSIINRRDWLFGYVCYDSWDTCNASLDQVKEYFGDRCVHLKKHYVRKPRFTNISNEPWTLLEDVKDKLNSKVRSY